MKATIISMRPAIGDKHKNIEKIRSSVKNNKSDLFVFGEMSLTGYSCKDDLFQLAETRNGPSIKKLKQLAEETDSYLVFGMPFKDEKRKGVLYNASVLVHPNGHVDVYKKWFLPNSGPFEEKLFFNEGEVLSVFPTNFGRVGLIICYDIYFPEITKAYALQGADLIICISASPSVTRPYFETVLPARAIENTTFLIYANIAGAQENLVFWGGSQAFDPFGNELAKGPYFEESEISFEFDIDSLNQIRMSRTFIRDIRPEIYLDLYDFSRDKK